MMERVLEHLSAGEFDAAEAACRELLAEDPGNAEVLFMLARVRQRQGDLDEALSCMESASQVDAFNPNLHHALGSLHVMRRELDEAQQSFLRAIEINPEFTEAHNGVAFVELARGRFKAAEHSANLALTGQPDNVQALIYMGTARLEQGHHKEAAAYLQEALRLDPANHNAQCQLGRAFLASGNAGFAMQCFENALQANPGSAELLDYLACAQLRSGQYQQAAGNFRKALTLGRSNAEIFSGLAKCELALGNQDQAEVLMRRAIELDPENALMVTTFAEYQIARGNAPEALELLGNLPPLESEQVQVLLARAHRQLDDPAAALQTMEAWYGTGNASTEASLDYATLLQDNGRQEQANELLQELLSVEDPPLAVRVFRAFQLIDQGDDDGAKIFRDLSNDPALAPLQRQGFRRSMAEALHRLGKHWEAAEIYLGMASSRSSMFQVVEEAQGENRELMESDRVKEVIAKWPTEPPNDQRPAPVFVFSWPGSGRERVITALEAHPDIMMIADQPGTQAHRRQLISSPAGARELTVIPDAGLQLARSRYWKDLRRGGLEPGERQPVDAMWLPAENLPTIARLFPEARVLVVKRDPRDMVMAWMQGGLTDLEAMARAYAQQLELLERCMTALPVEFIEIDYDDICENPEAQFARLVTGLGVSADAAVPKRFGNTKQAVSAEKGEWKHYSEALRDALDVFAS